MVTEKDKTDARQGETRHIVRYVLHISLSLAIVAMVAAWIYFYFTD